MLNMFNLNKLGQVEKAVSHIQQVNQERLTTLVTNQANQQSLPLILLKFKIHKPKDKEKGVFGERRVDKFLSLNWVEESES